MDDGHARAVGELLCLPPRLSGARIELGYRGTTAAGATVVDLTEVIELPGDLDHVEAATRERILRLLSFAASLSYFKAFAPARIVVPGGLTDQEREFLAQVVENGLGEFAFVNDLPEVFDTAVEAFRLPDAPRTGDGASAGPRRVLVAVGGGKDSIVSIEALGGGGFDLGLFAVNGYAPIDATAAVARLPLAIARRRLDPELLRLNAEGAPNGHVPVTAVNSLLALLTALALGYDTVVFSNEASSSYGNVVWHGRTVNHQWSKGLDFERLLNRSLPPGAPRYVSLLRPLTELRIARRFAQHRAYHQAFTSCNRAFTLDETRRTSWCGDCPKCRFVFLILAPFLSRDELLRIFGGRDLLADPRQTKGFSELLGADGLLKPFECVGEPDECRVALTLLREHPDWQDHPVLQGPDLHHLGATDAERDRVFAFRTDAHCLPPELEAVARAI